MVLLLASFVFYSAHNPLLLLLLLASLTITAVTSYKVVHGRPDHRKFWATIGVAINIVVLCFFKYSSLAYRTMGSALDGGVGAFLISIPLPIGISFYTFEGISLMVDVFRTGEYGKLKVAVDRNFFRHWLNTALFVSFFPHLVSGPILKAHDFLPQIRQKYFSYIHWEYAFKAIVLGYFLKMVVADNLNQQTFWIAYPHFQYLGQITLTALLFGYSIQIFSDFAGYSLIALGVASLFGYRLQVNFDFPYISSSFSEFWRRWHISLSTWLKEYLYISLGGNRKGKVNTYINLIITMGLGGLWHGAAWSYAVWGLWHGMALAAERLIRDYVRIPWAEHPLYVVAKTIFVFVFVTFGWLLFKLPEFSQTVDFLRAMAANTMVTNAKRIIISIILFSLPSILYHFYYLLRSRGIYTMGRAVEIIVYGVMLFLIIVNSGESNAFIYFQF